MKYDVIIIGAGPAGLKAAEVLAGSGRSVIVFEKNKIIGPKVCAAGITKKDLIHIPRKLITSQYDHFFMNYKGRVFKIRKYVAMIERKCLGSYMKDRAEKAGAKIITDTFIHSIHEDHIVARNKKYYFDRLIGADGSSSMVRRYLDLPQKPVLSAQFRISRQAEKIEAHFDTKKFSLWYAWIFPHDGYTYVGAALPLKDGNKLKAVLEKFTEHYFGDCKKHFEAALINSDYRGYQFGNIFLVGDAAGLANPFTGEGIYQAIVSGEEVARKIICPGYKSKRLDMIIRKTMKFNKLLSILQAYRALARLCYSAGFMILKYDWFKKKMTKIFLEY